MLNIAKLIAEFNAFLVRNWGKPIGLPLLGAFAKFVAGMQEELEQE